ncbi:hypothetical protein GUJ93_ZPchr0009g268 [Zizania palustris]|uniref:Uncharacterized protein n=1 Tax=Zizania palustris TaxID=103762 RepID=A0A8J5RND5_ZIZPA|nr:hypothetical protein GUJ93_ZPchr0009g268 [Zizania palustris]
MLIAEEVSQNKNKQPTSTDTALITTEGGSSTGTSSGARPDAAERTTSTNGGGRGGGRTFYGNGGRNGGRGHGRGRSGGRGNYNNGNNYNYGANNGNPNRPPFQQPPSNWAAYFPPWGAPWATGWRAPWTGATGPGASPRPSHQAYNAFSQPSTTSAPSTWDTSGLIQALHAASLQQPSNGEWFMDTGASTHMTNDQEGHTSSVHTKSGQICLGSAARTARAILVPLERAGFGIDQSHPATHHQARANRIRSCALASIRESHRFLRPNSIHLTQPERCYAHTEFCYGHILLSCYTHTTSPTKLHASH